MLASFVLVLLLVGATIMALLAIGAARWQAGTAHLRARLEATRAPLAPARDADLASLPAPVAAYLRAAIAPGQAAVTAVRIAHSGTMNLGTEAPRWLPFRSDQRVIAQPPGFDWDARVFVAPGLAVHVHDAYVAGEGVLVASFAGLRTLTAQRGGGDLARGELLRWFAEAAWCPTAFLPGAGVRWEPIDARTARGTREDGASAATLTFRFGADGLLATVRAEARGRVVGATTAPTPWEGRFWNYARVGGLLVPLDAEVAWMPPAGPWPYWRGHVERIRHEFAAEGPAAAPRPAP